METWFLLYDGSSPDGLGANKYVGRTTDKEVAREHFKKCYENPYSTGSVITVTDTHSEQAGRNTNWSKL